MATAKTPASKLTETILEAAKARSTGVIRFEQGPVKKQLALRGGLVVFAESNTQEDHLARIMVKMNLLKRTLMPEVAARMKSGKPADEAILACSKVNDEGVHAGAREQAVAILASVFSWDGCETHFYPGDGLIRRHIDLHMPLLELLVLAARRAISRHLLPDSPRIPIGSVFPLQKRREELLGLPLNGLEALALSLVQERIQASKLVLMLPAGEAKPEESIRLLALLGLVGLEESSSPAENGSPSDAAGEFSRERLEAMLHEFEVANLYEILAVSPEAAAADFKQAYHELARRYHPDRFQSNEYSPEVRSLVEKLFTYITGAYATLSDPAARASYDETRLTKESQVEATLKARAAADAEKDEMANTLFKAGRLSLSRGDFEKAARQLKECVWLRPDVARFQHYLGVAQSEIPHLRKEAEKHLLKSLELDQTSVESHLALGKLYISGNLLRRAEVQIEKVLCWDPENREALRLAAGILEAGIAGQRLREFLKR